MTATPNPTEPAQDNPPTTPPPTPTPTAPTDPPTVDPVPVPAVAPVAPAATPGDPSIGYINDPKNPGQKIAVPIEAVQMIRVFITRFGKEGVAPEEVKAKFLELWNSPVAIAQGPNRLVTARRGTSAFFVGKTLRAAGGKSYDMYFLPTAISSKPFQAKDQGQGEAREYSLRGFGLVRCADPAATIEGPSSVQVFNFTTEADGTRFASMIKPGHLYVMKGRLSDRSPTGVMKLGQIGVVQASAGDGPFKEVVPGPNGSAAPVPWPDPFSRLEASVPLTPLSELFTRPKEYAYYRVEGEINRGWAGTKNGRNMGTISIQDDSIDSDQTLAATKGGLSLFLPASDLRLAKLGNGSRISAIVSGSKKADKDGAGNATGEVKWNWNVHAIRVLVDLSTGVGLPEPGKTAMRIPAGEPGMSREV